ncbi:hypothetical protein DAETH_41740 (plasmid) [Deinococcus aetherius]|uniref:Uncharacterized protein n=1 Tax=Deinococcus aetherius TaxID=200252 RepID=A0ABM8AK57_9DEIO|nr:hypothetical protein [Deinococcus aetherius]BDP44205.1 hypothetical protein DAETH_41740 [Deinococcus aetherius]
MTRETPSLTTLVRGVRRRETGRRRWGRVAWAVAAGAGTLALFGLWQVVRAPLSLPPVSAPLATGLAGGLAALTLLGLELRASPPNEREAARLADRRLGLHDLLGTALTLPETANDPLEAALHARVRAQAEAAARPLRPANVVPPPSLAWGRLPGGLAALALVAWLVPPLRAPVRLVASAEPRAEAIRTQEPSKTASGGTMTLPSSATTPQPTPDEVAEAEEKKTEPSTPQAQAGTERSGGAVTTATGTGGRAPGLDRPREARNALVKETTTPGSEAHPGGGSTRDTPFGSRESGSFSEQEARSNPDALAAAPYDPSAPGSGTQKQKSGGAPEERRASGGRGVESDGDDRCARDCLTNNDMNRGSAPRAAKPPAPDNRNQSGTSDSGGGAAGSTSGVGLGQGRMAAVTVRFRQRLLAGNESQGDRVRVLAAPGTSPPMASPGAATAGPWTPQAEPPLTPDDIPAAAQDTVSAYFRRTP